MLYFSSNPDMPGQLVMRDYTVQIHNVPYRLDEEGFVEMREAPVQREVMEYASVKRDFWRLYKREAWPLHKALWGGFDHLATVAERKQLCQDIIDVEGPGSGPVVMNIFDRYEHTLELSGSSKEKITFKQATKQIETARINGLADLQKLYKESKERLATKDMVAIRKWMGEQEWLDPEMVKEVLESDADFKMSKKEAADAAPEGKKGRSRDEILASVAQLQKEIDDINRS